MTEQDIDIADIEIDPSVQPRVKGIDPDHVRTLQENPGAWPPITVVRRGARYVGVDCGHRMAAAQNLGLATIRATVVPEPEGGDLYGLAFLLNAAHGRPLSLDDRRAYAERLLRTDASLADREIARRCGLSSNTVGALRERLEVSAQIEQTTTRVGRSGYTYSGALPQRQPGELPLPTLVDTVTTALASVFSAEDRRDQRRIVSYLQRLATALEDHFDLEGWRTNPDAAEACQLVLGPERASELGARLGAAAVNILGVALCLGYEEQGSA